MSHVGMLLKEEEHLYQERPVAQGAKLLSRAAEAPPFPRSRDKNGDLV